MPDGFAVDLDTLQQAADGINMTLDEVVVHEVSSIGAIKSAFGHDHLAATVADFGDRWQLGVQHLTTDGQEVTSRLTDSLAAYQRVDQGIHDHMQGILSSPTGPDPAAP